MGSDTPPAARVANTAPAIARVDRPTGRVYRRLGQAQIGCRDPRPRPCRRASRRPVATTQRKQAARSARDARAARQPHGERRRADRWPVGRAPAGERRQERPAPRLAAAQGIGLRRLRGAASSPTDAAMSSRCRRTRSTRCASRSLVEEAAREPASAGANGAASAALELWRGAPLADVAAEPFAAAEIRRLEELHLRALELAIDAELAAGRHDEVIARLEALIAQEPLRERLHAQRMLALYRAGRQSEALEAYREAHRTLAEQIGVEPGPELRRLQEQILAQDPALDAPAPIAELPPQLEGGSPLLAGRERELGWLRRRWEQASEGRWSALVWGPAGIGKTRLVAELAAEVQGDGAAVLYAGGGEVADAALASVAEAGKRPPTDPAGARLRRRRAAGGARGGRRARPRARGPGAPDLRPAPRRAGPARLRRPARAAAPPSACGSIRWARTRPPRSRRSTRPPRAPRCRCGRCSPKATGFRFASTARPASGRGPRRRTVSSRPADQAADERTGLRAAEAELAGGVVDLQAAARTHPPLRARGARRSVRARGLPLPRPGALRRRPRRVLLRPRAPHRRARRPPGRLDPAGGGRPLGQRQVLGGARRALCRRSPTGSSRARSAGAGR